MSNTLADLRKSMSNLEGLTQKASEDTSKKFTDDRYWRPTLDAAGNGYAVIRFLPPAQVDGTDGQLWVQMFSHAFKGPRGDWYIENSLTTLGQKDPCGEYNAQLWNSGIESNKEIARKQKRKLSYISNILVINDPGNPDNNGKVFLFKYGKKIFAKLKEAMSPPFPDKQPINPFDFWSGANFKLKVMKGDGGWPNYDRSEFESPTTLSEDENVLNTVWASCYSLKGEIDKKNFKSYNDLKDRLDKVLGDGATGPVNAVDNDKINVPTTAAVSRSSGPVSFTDAVKTETKSTIDPSLADFQALANED